MPNPHDRRATWKPAKRPQWLAKPNALALPLDGRAIVSLDEASLLGEATRNTGLEDFGDDDWRPHFRKLIQLIEDEARLHFSAAFSRDRIS